ncbi:hypothetical protein [Gimesia aquarii]|uniref:Uncharacterized protein n=1 Tax=Gimesia aquarii TaxID=2527964 RepID=A0A517VXA7_9PLAN|nr:hypothetical protein [Gimesia aquarii]QDT97641.1 hypothetical protein V144x_31210 [Gimesia aquarii]
MSSINPSASNLQSSFAGAQKSEANVDKQKAEAAQQNMSIDKKAMTEHQMQDVGNADKSGDRDADGRMPFGFDGEEEHPESKDSKSEEHHSTRAPDAEGELGTNLDLDA